MTRQSKRRPVRRSRIGVAPAWRPAASRRALAGCYQTEHRAGRISDRLSPAPPDHGAGKARKRRGHGWPQSRRPHAEPTGGRLSHSRKRGGAKATSGIIIDVPRGGPTRHAAADSMREIRSILAAVGVPSNAIYVRHYTPDPICAGQHQAQLFEADRGGRTLRAMAEGPRPIASTQATSKIGRTGISAAPVNAISRPWSTIRPIWCSRAAKRRPMPPRRSVVLEQVPQGRKSLRHLRRL